MSAQVTVNTGGGLVNGRPGTSLSGNPFTEDVTSIFVDADATGTITIIWGTDIAA